jgi:elongator complex protein 3
MTSGETPSKTRARTTRLHTPRPVQDRPAPVPIPEAALADLLDALESGELQDKQALHNYKLRLARKHRLVKVPSDSDLMAALPKDAATKHRALLRKKLTRTLSGVAIVTLQASPAGCPHGTCIFCPGGPDVGTAQSYTGEEPAAMRARQHFFDPYAQTASRLAALQSTGHDTDKVDLIIQGGTFPAREADYQIWFIKRALDAMNDAALPWPRDKDAHPGASTIQQAQKTNEEAPARLVGLTVETKPDWWLRPHVDLALTYGATRVEVGVQTLDEEVLHRTNRGHTMAHTIESTKNAKEAGFKLVHHLMPGLPGSDLEQDLDNAVRLFSQPDHRPDMLKIYPTLVVPGTPLSRLHERGEYEALGTEDAARLIARIKRTLPPYVRIQRVDRDIPTTLISGGVDRSNLRELAHDALRIEYGERCLCVRCREVGIHRRTTGTPDPQEEELCVSDHTYQASDGEERFLAIESRHDGALMGYLRLRRLADPHREELQAGDAMIREVKVPGTIVPIGARDTTAAQHRGFGARLVHEAARIANEEWDAPRLHVIAGVGVKPYYRRLGFHDNGVYLSAPPRAVDEGTAPSLPRPEVPRAWDHAWDLDRHPRPASERQKEPVPPIPPRSG